MIFEACESLTKNGKYSSNIVDISNGEYIFLITLNINNKKYQFESYEDKFSYFGPFHYYSEISSISPKEFYNKFLLSEIRDKIINEI